MSDMDRKHGLLHKQTHQHINSDILRLNFFVLHHFQIVLQCVWILLAMNKRYFHSEGEQLHMWRVMFVDIYMLKKKEHEYFLVLGLLFKKKKRLRHRALSLRHNASGKLSLKISKIAIFL